MKHCGLGKDAAYLDQSQLSHGIQCISLWWPLPTPTNNLEWLSKTPLFLLPWLVLPAVFPQESPWTGNWIIACIWRSHWIQNATHVPHILAKILGTTLKIFNSRCLSLWHQTQETRCCTWRVSKTVGNWTWHGCQDSKGYYPGRNLACSSPSQWPVSNGQHDSMASMIAHTILFRYPF